MSSTEFFSQPTIKTTMSDFSIMNLDTILGNHNDKSVRHYFYKHKTSGANIFKCNCCEFEAPLYITATKSRVNKKEQLKEYDSMVKNIHAIKKHFLSYEHRFNEYYDKGLVPVIPEFDGDLINNTFDFFKDHITSVADDNGLFWCDLCDTSFKTRKQLYTHLVKSNKKHLVRQVEKELPYKVIVSDNTYYVEYQNKKVKITPELRAKMENYKDENGYCCKYCFYYKCDDEEEFYNHLRSKKHKKNKILADNTQTYVFKEKTADDDLIYTCNKCNCDVDDIVTHHMSH